VPDLLASEAAAWWRRHFDSSKPTGPVVRLSVEYQLEDRLTFGGAFVFSVPLVEWRDGFAGAVMREAFADLARHLEAEHPGMATEILADLAILKSQQ
jgi:hypothetical protein